jgi:2'-5' RNA ligase
MTEFNATAHFRQAAKGKDFDWPTAQHYLAETTFTKNHQHQPYSNIGEAQAHADRIAKAEGISSPSVDVKRGGGEGSRYWHSGRYGDSGPEIALSPDHMHEAALIHEMTHHFRHETGQSEGHDAAFSRNYGALLSDHHSRGGDARAEFRHYHQAADEHMRANPDFYQAPPDDGPEASPRTATAFFAQAVTDRYTATTKKEAEHGHHAPRGTGGDRAPRGHAARPATREPERDALRRRKAAAEGVEHHPELQGDLDRLGPGARHVTQTIDALHKGDSGVTTYPLSHPLEGWHAALSSSGHQVVHRHEGNTLHVGYAGHNITDAEQRLGDQGSKALPVHFHGGAEKDFDSMPSDIQGSVLDTVDRLSRREPRATDHALGLPLRGWSAAHVPGHKSHRVTHRYEAADGTSTAPEHAERLFIGHIGPHNYGDAIKRLTTLTDFFSQADLRQTASVDDGKLTHRAPGPDDAPLHDPTRPVREGGGCHEQINLDNPDWGGMGEPHEESMAAVHRARGNPEAPVTIYRAAPHGVSRIRTGDWVATSAEHARMEAAEGGKGDHDGPDDPAHDWPVLKATVPAKHVRTDGNDINEWGYNGPHIDHPAVHGPDEDWTEPTHHTAARLTEAEEGLLQRQSAAVEHDDGVMVAFVPPREVAGQLALQGGQMGDDLHITLAYLGNVSDYTKEQLTLLPQLVSAWAMRQKAVTIHIAGVGTFNNAYKNQHVLWAHPDIPGGVQMHVSLADYLDRYGYRLPSEHGWTAHMTLRYVDRHTRFMPQLPEVSWEATEVVTFVGAARHAARLGLRPSTPTTL